MEDLRGQGPTLLAAESGTWEHQRQREAQQRFVELGTLNSNFLSNYQTVTRHDKLSHFPVWCILWPLYSLQSLVGDFPKCSSNSI